MALLNRLLHSRHRAAWLALAALGLAGCVLIQKFSLEPAKRAFDHRAHVVDQGLECTDCHAAAQSADSPGMPLASQCQLCHAEIDAKKSPEHRASALYAGEKVIRPDSLELSSEVIFSHRKHATSGMECATCHAPFAGKSDAHASLAPVRMEACVACHRERKVSTDCATCHTQIRSDVAPPSHAANWMKAHGRVALAKDELTASNCAACHSDSGCTSCHTERAPENHTVYWRRKAHGFTARMDRTSCAVCHKDDSCEACHSSTQPSTHVGSWGAPKDRHCLSCHAPLKSDDCSVCHQGTPSHSLAVPKPPGHNAGMNCRMCHGHGQPLPHVDNGENCNDCHH